jgi:hypothetical protein
MEMTEEEQIARRYLDMADTALEHAQHKQVETYASLVSAWAQLALANPLQRVVALLEDRGAS